MMEHSGTHIDALCHQACDLTFYGGVKVDDVERTDGYRELGVGNDAAAARAAASCSTSAALKGVAQLPQNYAITADDLVAAARGRRRHGSAGDVLLVRTGYATALDRRSDLSERGRRVEVRKPLGG